MPAKRKPDAVVERARPRLPKEEKQERTRRRRSSARVKKSFIASYILLAAVVLFVGGIRLRLRDMPLERDEGEYAYAGQLLLEGIPPYVLAYNMKLPGTYLSYAAIMAVLGESPAAIHLGLALVNAAATVLLFFLAWRILDATAAVIAAASFAILSTSPSVLGFAGHATHFVVLAALAGILLLLDAQSGGRLSKFLYAGGLLGLAFLMKQPGILFVLFAAIWLGISSWRAKPGWRLLAARFALFSAGVSIPFALTCLWLSKAHVFPRFWFWIFTYARFYGTMVSLRDAPGRLWSQASRVMSPALPIWLLAALGILGLLWKRRSSDACRFALVFLLCSFLAVCPGFYFREHYFILILPAVSLLAGAGITVFANDFAGRESLKALRPVLVLLFIAALGYAVWQQGDFYFEDDPDSACHAQYGGNPFLEAVRIADYLKAHSSPSSTLAILGSEPEIYFYAHRRSATGYIYMYPLMEEQPYAAKMQQEMTSEIERGRPEFIVMVNLPLSWLGRPGSSTLVFDWAQKYLSENYQLDGIVDVLTESEYRWGSDAANYRPNSPYTVQIFKRTSSTGQP